MSDQVDCVGNPAPKVKVGEIVVAIESYGYGLVQTVPYGCTVKSEPYLATEEHEGDGTKGFVAGFWYCDIEPFVGVEHSTNERIEVKGVCWELNRWALGPCEFIDKEESSWDNRPEPDDQPL